MGWAGVKNGNLMRLAEAEFDVFVTVDRNLSYQQNLPKFSIAVVVLKATSNRLTDLQPFGPKIIKALPTLVKGKAEIITL